MPRVIAGSARGIKLETNREEFVRPTTDRFKEAVFSSLQQDIVSGKIEDFLDLFGGSGQIALEAKSRGVKNVVVVEKNKQALKLIFKNKAKTQLEIRIMTFSAENAIKLLSNKGEQFDIIYFDPPWSILHDFWQEEEMNLIRLLKPNGKVIVEHHRKFPLTPDQTIWQIEKEKHYSDSKLLLLSVRNSDRD